MSAKIAPIVLKRLDYLQNKIGKDLSKDSVISYLDGLSFDEKKSFIEDYWKNTGFAAKNAPKFEKEGKDLIATIYYPLAVDVVKALNNEYSNSLTSLVRKFIEYKQVYLSINAKKNPDALTFSGISSRYVPEVKFYARASSNTWNAGLGFELKK
jgi:hypothetical protein